MSSKKLLPLKTQATKIGTQVAHTIWQSTRSLDADIIAVMTLRVWTVIAGVVSIVVVPMTMSGEEQGYYYTFNAVLAAQVFFELGINQVLIQVASHEIAKINLANKDSINKKSEIAASILALLQLTSRWTRVTARLLFLTLLIVGGIFFSRNGETSSVNWAGVWIVLTLITSVNIALSAPTAVFEGLGCVAQIARLRLKYSLIGNLTFWGLLFGGINLWGTLAVPVATAVLSWQWIKVKKQELYTDLKCDQIEKRQYVWSRDVWPLQWRVALTWVAGYFTVNIITPTIFARQGAVAAGQLGLAITVFSTISTISFGWVSAKFPELSKRVARQEKKELNELFEQLLTGVVVIAIAGTAILLAATYLTQECLPDIRNRLPSNVSLILLGIAGIANAITFSFAAYLRAHRKEPMLIPTLIAATVTVIGILLASHIGVEETVGAYAAVAIFISLPLSYGIYRKYRTM